MSDEEFERILDVNLAYYDFHSMNMYQYEDLLKEAIEKLIEREVERALYAYKACNPL